MIFHPAHIIFVPTFLSPLYQVGDTDKVGEGARGCVVSSLKTEMLPIYRDSQQIKKFGKKQPKKKIAPKPDKTGQNMPKCDKTKTM
jgi:hypothetical protein